MNLFKLKFAAGVAACTLVALLGTALPASAAVTKPLTSSDTLSEGQIDPMTVEAPTAPEANEHVGITYWNGDTSDITSEQASSMAANGVTPQPFSEPVEPLKISEDLIQRAPDCELSVGENVVDGLAQCAASGSVDRSDRSAALQGAESLRSSMSAAAVSSDCETALAPIYLSRTKACMFTWKDMYVVDPQTKNVMGSFRAELVTTTSTLTTQYMQAENETSVRVSRQVGYAIGRPVNFTGDYGCSSPTCKAATTGFNQSVSNTWVSANGTARLTFGVSQDTAEISENWRFTFTMAGVLASSDIVGLALRPRCDNNAVANMGQGCVYWPYTPTVTIPTTGITAEAGAHIAKAIASGLPSELRRVSPAAAQDNRSRKCKSSLVRPAGYECDEYPFASAYAAETPRVLAGCGWEEIPGSGPNGFSRCLIPAAANRAGGQILATFYRTERVLPNDKFKVRTS